MDSPAALKSWEQKFDGEICQLIGRHPKDRAAFVPSIEALLSSFSIEGEDRRARGGALWVFADESRSGLTSRLRTFGFKYRAGKGWFKE